MQADLTNLSDLYHLIGTLSENGYILKHGQDKHVSV
jgi:hypothetical protein